MTPEKLQLLREWIRAEIKYSIGKYDGRRFHDDKYRPHIDPFDKSDDLFFQVVQAFCGTD